ncbi:MAG TPA: hypothetical protein PKG52_07950 [bacterium]|nr:hypothetical protein [bacterium]HPS29966.1 hypothetical protein [bacterium]
MVSVACASLFVGLKLFLGFEFRVVREFENLHYGWYCSFSINEGPALKTERSQYYYNEQFENIFLNSEEMDEIKNQINYLLETEDEQNGQTPEQYPEENTSFDSPADSS